METHPSPLRIAVIGGGVAGITAAFALDHGHDVTLFEKNDYVGGHTNTISVKEGDRTIAVDTGFIVCNRPNYPTFYRLLEKLGVTLRDAEMSFGFACERSGFGYIGPGFSEIMRRPMTLLNPSFLQLALQQRKFNARALNDLRANRLPKVPLHEYVAALGCTQQFVDDYLIPISAAIWSTPERDILSIPTTTFVTFFNNHGMLALSKRPQWQTVVGGSQSYVRAFKEQFQGTIRTSSAVRAISRGESHVTVLVDNDERLQFDRVILACHADEAHAILSDASDEESKALGAWRYYKNEAVLHSDVSVLPADRKLWASWNYFRRARPPHHSLLAVSYYMNRLQGLNNSRDYIVTLNPDTPIDDRTVHYRVSYSHPAYTEDSIVTQRKLRALNGVRNTFYCGSYMGYGFHEDAASSALDVAMILGGSL